MSAANLVQSSGELSESKAREPSMEDILASIRRIIAQDQALFAAEDATRGDVDADANESAEAPLYGAAETAQARTDQHDGSGAGQTAQHAPGGEWSGDSGERLASKQTEDSVAGAFNALVASRFAQNSEAVLALTREALRPLLEAWLDAHLPALVERLVRAEIERMMKAD